MNEEMAITGKERQLRHRIDELEEKVRDGERCTRWLTIALLIHLLHHLFFT